MNVNIYRWPITYNVPEKEKSRYFTRSIVINVEFRHQAIPDRIFMKMTDITQFKQTNLPGSAGFSIHHLKLNITGADA